MIPRVSFKEAVRSLLRRPGDSVVQLVTLVAVVAAATVIFSILEGVLLRPLPFPEAEELYRVFLTSVDRRDADDPEIRASWNRLGVTRDALRAWNDDAGPIEVGGYVPMQGPWGDDEGSQDDVEGAFALQEFFDVLAVEPVIGRLPTSEEVRSSAQLVVLSEDFWTTRYGRDPGVLGRTVRYTWTSGTVVGVLPRSVAIPSARARWWSPVPANFADGATDVRQISGIVRVGQGVLPDVAAQVFAADLAGLAPTNPAYQGLGVSLSPLQDEIVGDVRSGIMQLFSGVCLVILIASLNLGILVVARTAGRKGDLAVRAALGARRIDLAGSILAEVLVLCTVGSFLGVVLAVWMLDPVVGLLSGAFPGFPRLSNVSINATVLVFAAGIMTGTALLSGLTPALIWSKRHPWEAMKGTVAIRGGRGVRVSQRGLLLLESGLAVILLVATGLLLRSVVNSYTVDPGFDDHNTAFLKVRFPGAQARFTENRSENRAVLWEAGRRLEDRIGSLPMVASVARVRGLPGVGGNRTNLVWTPERGQEGGGPAISVDVSPGYFHTMDIPLVQGRVFDDFDGPGSGKVAVVSERFARVFFGDADPVGRTVLFGVRTRPGPDGLVADEGEPIRVVGVVGDVRQTSLVADPEPILYMPLAQWPALSQWTVVKSVGDPTDALAPILGAVEGMEDRVTVAQWGSLGSTIRQPLEPLAVRTLLLMSLSALAGLLTLVGIYGVVAHVVSNSTREIGIRMALGAARGREAMRVMFETLRPVALGALGGLVVAAFVSRVLEQALYGVEVLDPPTYAGVLALLALTGAVTAWIPARRAAAVEPARILDEE